jgi:lysophospholipase L1-like esterase
MTPGRTLTMLAAGLLACGLTLAPAAGPALAEDAQQPQDHAQAPHECHAPLELTRLTQPLTRTARRLARGLPLKIVAIGSSSTAGAGASSPAASYPSRLAVEMRALFPHSDITVINRGVNGEEMPDMLARFETAVLAEKPDLVLWQVGTNSVLRDHPVEAANPLILAGVRRLKEIGADVVMIDPQYAPRVIAKPGSEIMVGLISTTAKEANVDLFQRFAVMKSWHDDDHMDFPAFVSADGLHMNDWSYGCIAKLIGGSIAEAATRGVASAMVAHSATH